MMVTKNKDDWLNIRVGHATKDEIQREYVDKMIYPSLSAFVIAAIHEKLDPLKRDEAYKKGLSELKKRDPGFFRELLR